MKQKLKLNTLKRVKDESVRKQLSQQFPADWDMEHIFEKSYQNYLKQSKKQEIPHFISVKRNQYMKVLVTVACVALTFGTFGMTLFLFTFFIFSVHWIVSFFKEKINFLRFK